MIKVGIYGSASIDDPVRKQLLRLLLRHPDVDLRAVASPAGNTVPIAGLYPVYAGETELTLERVLKLKGLDVLFVIDEENLTDDIRKKFDEDPEFRLVVLGKAPSEIAKAEGESGLVYGLAEHNRKALVRGARGAVCPRAHAQLVELALFPMAKNGLLTDNIKLTLSGSPAKDDVAEAVALLTSVQPDFGGDIALETSDPAPYDRLDLRLSMPTPLAIEEIQRIYDEAYSDHNFVYVIPGEGVIDEDLRGSNKCLIRLNSEDGKLVIDASLDALTKGCTGNAVHIMNLLFGLHERTGLSI